ncbi:MAG: hypothetical protein WBN68_15370, partial [Sedimenticolaceae bacterium]
PSQNSLAMCFALSGGSLPNVCDSVPVLLRMAGPGERARQNIDGRQGSGLAQNSDPRKGKAQRLEDMIAARNKGIARLVKLEVRMP